MLERPGRTILTVLSIVIGVAAVVSVTLVIETTREASRTLLDKIKGKASLEIASPTTAPIAEGLAQEAAKTPGVIAAVPVVQQLGKILKQNPAEDDDQPASKREGVIVTILGIDPERDEAVRELEIVAGRRLSAGNEAMLDVEYARQLQLPLNGRMIIQATKKGLNGRQEVTIVGLVKAKGASAMTMGGVVFIPIEKAQSWFLGKGPDGGRQVSSIQIVTAEGADPKAIRKTLVSALPPSLDVRSSGGSSDVLRETLFSTEQGLRLTTGFTLLLAGFIILNTFLMNVGERRRQLAITRAIGATRMQLIGMLVEESLLLGVIGTIVGIGVGVFTAHFVTDFLKQLMKLELPPNHYGNVLAYLLAAAFGLIITMIGALVPTIRVWRVSPLEGMSRVAPEDMVSVPLRYVAIGGVLVVASGIVIGLAIAGRMPIDAATIAAIPLLMGVVLLMPIVLAPLAKLAVAPMNWFYRVESDLALRQILRHRGRTTLTIGVLFIAGSTGIGMAHSILDNVGNLRSWCHRTMAFDYVVRSMLPDFSTGESSHLPEAVEADVRAVPGVQNVDRARGLSIKIKKVKSAAPAAATAPPPPAGEEPEDELNVILGCREFHMPGDLPLDLIHGDKRQIREQMKQGELVVGNIVAHRLQLALGDKVELPTKNGPRQFVICGITNEYLFGGLSVYLNWDVGKEQLAFQGTDGLVIHAQQDDDQEVKERLKAIAKKHGVLLLSAGEIGRVVDHLSNGISGGLWGLVFLGFVVAAFGVVNTLTMNVLEQTRELGLLRIVAMTKAQVMRTIVGQAMIIGCVGLAPGILVGLGIAYIMNLAMKPSIGREIEFNYHPWLMLGTLAVSLTITLVAAWIPAQRAARINVVDALHYE